MERSLTSTQEKLSLKVGETAKLENSHRKLQTELRTMKERNSSYEDELADQKQMIGHLSKHKYLCINCNKVFLYTNLNFWVTWSFVCEVVNKNWLTDLMR